MSDKYGWQCPACQSVFAPFVAMCMRCPPPKPTPRRVYTAEDVNGALEEIAGALAHEPHRFATFAREFRRALEEGGT